MLTAKDAEMTICKGVSLVEGAFSLVPHTASRRSRYNGTVSIGDGKNRTGRSSKNSGFEESLAIALNTAVECISPWEVLERPAVGLAFGPQPTTITLDHLVSMGSCHAEAAEAAEAADSISRVQPRKMEVLDILNRLDLLQHGGVDEDVSLGFPSHMSLAINSFEASIEGALSIFDPRP